MGERKKTGIAAQCLKILLLYSREEERGENGMVL